MKAMLHNGKPGYEGLTYGESSEPTVKAGEVKVKLKTAGLNHRDLFVLNSHIEQVPLIIGTDGAGIVTEIGEDVTTVQVDQEVVVIPSLGWQKKSCAPPKGFEILGVPDNGTFAEFIVLPEENIAPKPDHLNWEQAGVLGSGALTGYRALFIKGNLQAGQTVFIPGIGSGVATFMLQMAKAVGARVIVSSRSAEKREKALQLGADLTIDSESDWRQDLQGESIDLVIDSVGNATMQKSIDAVKRGGTIVTFGASAGETFSLNLREFFARQYNLLGTTLGSVEEFHDMLADIQQSKWAPVIDSVYSLEDTPQALRRLEKGKQFGKIALKIS